MSDDASTAKGRHRGPRQAEPDDELLEVIDAEGHVVELRRRVEIHGDPTLRHRAVHIFVRDGAGRVLLQLRSRQKKVQPGKWDTAVGGHVDPGESYEQAALRELAEELGVHLDDGVAGLSHCHDYIWRSTIETEHVRTFELRSEGPFEPSPVEIDELRFFDREQLRRGARDGSFTPNLVNELERFGLL
jgi:isopentenyldiphosphate isomerase